MSNVEVFTVKKTSFSVSENAKRVIRNIIELGGSKTPQIPYKNHNCRLLIPDILLNARLEFINFHLVGNELKRHGTPAYMIVHFPPQHITEGAFYETAEGDPKVDAPLPACSVISGCSRLVFKIPSSTTTIPYSLDQLLKWENYSMNVPRAAELMAPTSTDSECNPVPLDLIYAVGEADKENVPPDPLETSIELPYRLFLSPSASFGGWVHEIPKDTELEHLLGYHSPFPQDHNPDTFRKRKNGAITELWHTRFAVRYMKNGKILISEAEKYQYLRTLSAVWSSDYFNQSEKSDPSIDPPTSVQVQTMNRNYRHQIVDLSSNYKLKPLAQPIEAERLMLTSLGAWMNTRGYWDLLTNINQNYTLIEWVHRTTMGRDQYVKLVNLGYLFPFGHRAACVTISERKIQKPALSLPQNNVAYLRQHKFIVVLQPEKVFTENDYPNAVPSPGYGKDMPFRRVRIKTHSTPWISNEQNNKFVDESPNWPFIEKQNFLFHMIAEDWKEQIVEFSAPLMWVPNDYIENYYTDYKTKATSYNTFPGLNRIVLNGQKVAYANSGTVDDVSFPTAEVLINVEISNQKPDPKNSACFHPIVKKAVVTIPAIKHLAGSNENSCTILLRDGNKNVYPPDDKSGVFLQLENKIPLEFKADQSGGIATPSMAISAISWKHGPVGGDPEQLRTLATGGGSPLSGNEFLDQFFSGAKLLGSVSLSSIISNVFNDGKNLPKIVTESVDVKGSVVDPLKNPDQIVAQVTKLSLTPQLQNSPLLTFKNVNNSFSISAVIRTPVKGDPPSTTINGKLEHFTINLLGIISLPGDLLEFNSVSGQKMQVNAQLGKVEFIGPLTFLNSLSDLIEAGGFSDPPSLDVTADGISSSYTLGLPPIAVGAFSLQNITLSSSLNIPWMGETSVKFGFAEKNRPFLVTVSVFGGGGYCCLELTPAGLKSIEVGLDFGGCFAINLGVASGGVYVLACIAYLKQSEMIKLSGTLKAGGAVEILKLITVSVEFDLGLEYLTPTNELWGRAVLIVEIKIAFFSKSVDLPMERRFAGSCKSPTVKDLMEFDANSSEYQFEIERLERYNEIVKRKYENYWDAYWDAFAEA